MINWFERAQELFPYSQSVRRDLHQHPELGYKEVRTAGIIANELRALDLEVTTGIAETGVVALLEGENPGPVVLLRFDMDALPVDEQTEAEYCSLNPGRMHACGHDGHVATGLTVARMLSRERGRLHGTVKFVFQPAEEGLGGAERMVAAGVMESPHVDYCLALHLWNEKPLGWMGIPEGPLMAGADIFRVWIEGKGGHGALPHLAVDPIAAAAYVITALQGIISRNVSPLENAVISVTQIHAGETFNVIPPLVELAGTIRAFEASVRNKVARRFEEVVQSSVKAAGCTARIELSRLTPAVINTPSVAVKVAETAEGLFPDGEIDRGYRTMVSEDMAFLMEKAPGCYFMIGSANPEKGLDYGHHHPKFDFDEQALPRAAALMAAAAEKLLS